MLHEYGLVGELNEWSVISIVKELPDTIKYPRQLIALWFEKQIRNKTHIKEVIDQTDKTVSQRENKK